MTANKLSIAFKVYNPKVEKVRESIKAKPFSYIQNEITQGQ